jgi:hypothetical protein
MPPLGLDGWSDEPHYKQCYTPNLRGEFILTKLMQRDPKTFQTLLVDTFRGMEPLPGALTALDWRIILTAMGASVSEIAHVLTRMGRQDG